MTRKRASRRKSRAAAPQVETAAYRLIEVVRLPKPEGDDGGHDLAIR